MFGVAKHLQVSQCIVNINIVVHYYFIDSYYEEIELKVADPPQ